MAQISNYWFFFPLFVVVAIVSLVRWDYGHKAFKPSPPNDSPFTLLTVEVDDYGRIVGRFWQRSKHKSFNPRGKWQRFPLHHFKALLADELQVAEKDGERGRNRTFNLLFGSQTLTMNDFNEFPMIYEGMVRRF